MSKQLATSHQQLAIRNPRCLAQMVVISACCLLPIEYSSAADWLHWRGPEQNGVSRDTGLPAKWSRNGENLVWKQPHGGRSAPLVSRGRVYIINSAGSGINEQERVMCFDAKSGQVLWEHKFNIFHTNIVTNRVGWANLAADPETGNIYAHGVQGLFFCFDPDGKVLWSKSLTEEYGRVSGYGGRIGSPIVDGDLVIIDMLNSSWGEQGPGRHRFMAMDKKTGHVIWWSEPGNQPEDTVYSIPVITNINGERLLICGNADGAIYALQVSTGKKVWGYLFSKRGINVSPVVDGNLVYIAQSEENLDTTIQGSVLCLDAGTVTNGQPKLVWRRTGLLVGYASPIIHEGRLYVCDNSAAMYCLDAKDGRTHWELKYGTVAKGSPVWADGKIYVGEVTSRFHIIEPGSTSAKIIHTEEFPRGPNGEVFEINGSASVAEGRVFVVTQDGLYCIGTPEGKAGEVPGLDTAPSESPGAPAQLLIVPADVVTVPGGSVTFKVRSFDGKGRFLKEETAEEWTLPPFQPPSSPGAPARAPVPGLKGEIKEGHLQVAKEVSGQAGVVAAKLGELTATARVRVAPLLPIEQDFEKIPEGAVPGGWINTSPAKFVVEMRDGSKTLKKKADNPSPAFARANAYIGMPSLSNYTIEADMMGTEKRRNLPDMGVINARYSLVLDGTKDRLLLRSWEANHRLEERLDFKVKANVWYHFKLMVTVEDGKGVCRGKVWPKGEKEPEAWMIEAVDPIPNAEGSPALYAYAKGITGSSPGAEIFYDNIRVYANEK